MCFQVQAVSSLSQTLLLLSAPHDPSGNRTYPVGGNWFRYSAQVISLSGESGLANSSATFFSHSGPSNHQCPNSSESNGAVKTGTPGALLPYCLSASAVMCAKCFACSAVRPSAIFGSYGCFKPKSVFGPVILQ